MPFQRVCFAERRLDITTNRDINVPSVFKPKIQGIWTSGGTRLDVVRPKQVFDVIIAQFRHRYLEIGNAIGEFTHELSRVEPWRDVETPTQVIVVVKGASGEMSAHCVLVDL